MLTDQVFPIQTRAAMAMAMAMPNPDHAALSMMPDSVVESPLLWHTAAPVAHRGTQVDMRPSAKQIAAAHCYLHAHRQLANRRNVSLYRNAPTLCGHRVPPRLRERASSPSPRSCQGEKVPSLHRFHPRMHEERWANLTAAGVSSSRRKLLRTLCA